MDIELAVRILVNNGYLVTVADTNDLVVIEHPTRRVRIEEIRDHLFPFVPELVSFSQVNDRVQVFFD